MPEIAAGTGITLDNSTPEVLEISTAFSDAAPLTDLIIPASGTAVVAARADHRHPLGGVFHQRFQSGQYYSAFSVTASNVAVGTGIIHATPFYVSVETAFDQIGLNVGTAGVGSIRLGIYNDSGGGLPSSLLAESGTVDVGTTGVKVITITRTLAPGLYWLAAQAETTTNASITHVSNFVLGARQTSTAGSAGFSATTVTGSLPATFSATPNAVTPIMRVILRAV